MSNLPPVSDRPDVFTLWYRDRERVINDPQRRCYHGAFLNPPVEQWGPWKVLYYPLTREMGEDSIKTYTRINGNRSEYLLTEPVN